LKTDHWFYGLFQSAPDLIALLLPTAGAAGASAVPSLGPDAPGDVLTPMGRLKTQKRENRHRIDHRSHRREHIGHPIGDLGPTVAVNHDHVTLLQRRVLG